MKLIASLLFCTTLLWAQGVPNSARSRKAVAKQTPILKKEFQEKGLTWGSQLFIRIFKESGELEVWIQNGTTYEHFRTYPICSFSGDLGPKLKQGDNQAPEGFYFVPPSQMNPHSTFHLSFNLGYPNSFDRAHRRTGNYLMVHGNCVSIGCYAMQDDPIEKIWTLMDAAYRRGQPYIRVHIFPFRMTKSNLERHRQNSWYSFWKNLQEGYIYFEKNKIPPNTVVRQKRYSFES